MNNDEDFNTLENTRKRNELLGNTIDSHDRIRVTSKDAEDYRLEGSTR